MASDRHYELVLLGANGYTGRLAAEYIATNLPTDLRWAIAGRSRDKLSSLAEDIQKLNPNRQQPGEQLDVMNRMVVDSFRHRDCAAQ